MPVAFAGNLGAGRFPTRFGDGAFPWPQCPGLGGMRRRIQSWAEHRGFR